MASYQMRTDVAAHERQVADHATAVSAHQKIVDGLDAIAAELEKERGEPVPVAPAPPSPVAPPPPPVYELVQADEDTMIDTVYGPVLVTAGNYIATDPDGGRHGVAAEDVAVLYTPA